MSEVITETPTEPVGEGATPEPTEELGENGVKALAAEREARKVADKTAADLVKRLKEFEDRDKTETQKQQEELEEARKELAALNTAKTRAEVAADKSVPNALLLGPASSSAEDIAKFADALIAFRGEQGGKGPHAPREGSTPSQEVSEEQQFAAKFFGGGN